MRSSWLTTAKPICGMYEGERPLFASHGLYLEEVTIHAGESALKECSDIEAVNCRFEGKYPFWHNDGFVVKNCLFTEGARAALWYSKNLKMKDTLVEAPKMFREMDGVELENVQLPNALETLWYCRNVELNNVKIDKGDYLFIHGEDIRIKNFVLNGNYSFQYCIPYTVLCRWLPTFRKTTNALWTLSSSSKT